MHLEEPTKSAKKFHNGYFLSRAFADLCDQAAFPDNAEFVASSYLRHLKPTRDFSRLPSTHVILAEYDMLHDEGAQYAETLKKSGVEVTVTDYPNTVHGFLSLGFTTEAYNSVSEVLKVLKGKGLVQGTNQREV